MIGPLLAKVFGTKHERDIKKILPTVEAINALEPRVSALSDDALRARVAEIRAQIQARLAESAPEDESKAERRARYQETLDEHLVEVFAMVREGAKRSIGLRPYDVQLMGGIILHQGKISEMKTGEGKTLVATLPVTLNALAGRGVHVVTVNDYLARRDADWMGRVYKFLGLTVGCNQHSLSDRERQVAYDSDITYGTNNEYGFDYLRDNMKFDVENMVQRRGHHYAIVDEVDSILIDEARTPLIISGPSEESTESYYRCDRIVPKLVRGEEKRDDRGEKYTTGDYLVDERAHTVVLTEEGVAHAERLLGVGNLYEPSNMEVLHAVNQALKAHVLYKRDVEYVVNEEGEVVIVDEFTGRLMPGRRWSDGLHQAVEAKEGVKIEAENQTLATITFQNYFRMYDKLGGMTGTAETEAVEFDKIYTLEVVVVPTNRPMVRSDNPDLVYLTEGEKFAAVVEEIAELHEKGQPVLVGTISIEKSETLSTLLKHKKIPHVVLNAKYHEKEAEIVAQAGKKAAVTIATNMAGRGTDILLGGNPEYMANARANRETSPAEYEQLLTELRESCAREHDTVVDVGGLHILGTERHESRRIDNQLRGRSGRQGDPGSSRFYLSLEDDLMRIFGSDRISGLMQKLGMEEGVPIEHGMVTRAIRRAQEQVESRNFEVRKHLLEYDDVMNKQREAIYRMRRDILDGREGKQYFLDLTRDIVDESLEARCPPDKDPRDWDISGLDLALLEYFGADLGHAAIKAEDLGVDELRQALYTHLEGIYQGKEDRIGAEMMRLHEKYIALQIVDQQWKDHLLTLDHLKEGIGMRAYGQRDPLVEYKKESFTLFEDMKERIENDIIKFLFRLQVVVEGGAGAGSSDDAAADGAASPLPPRRRQPAPPAPRPPRQVAYSAPPKDAEDEKPDTVRRTSKVGRNEPCPCGSGKKYKKCHGVAA